MTDDDVLTAAELLDLQRIGENRLRSVRNQDNRSGAIFGGQPLGQALAAARTTVRGDWPAHYLSAMFLRGGVVAEPVDYAVEVVRDGRRYASRRVLATQAGKPIFDLLCSFHDPEGGEPRQMDMGDPVPPPEDLPDMRELCLENADRLSPGLIDIAGRPFPVELRLVDAERYLFDGEMVTHRAGWFRIPTAAAIDDPRAHESLLAFASDYWLAGTASAGYGTPGSRMGPAVASLNHSLWFAGPVDTADWLLLRTDSPSAGHGRGIARGLIYDRFGRLVASVVQEVSVRAI